MVLAPRGYEASESGASGSLQASIHLLCHWSHCWQCHREAGPYPDSDLHLEWAHFSSSCKQGISLSKH